MKPSILALVRPAVQAGGGVLGAGLDAAPLIAAAPATDAPSEVSGQQIFLFALTYVAYVAIYFARKPVSVVKSTLESELGIPLSALGGVDTALLFAYAVGQFMTGTVVSIFGRTVPLAAGYTICGLMTVAFGFVSSAKAMMVLWGICGFFAASINPLLVLYVADLFPASMRASAVGLWQTSQQVGGVAANTVASALLSSQGWRAVFKVSGLIVAVFAPILTMVLAFSGRKTAAPPAPAKPTASAAKESKPSVLSLPGVRSVGAAYTLVKMSRYCLMFWLPYFLTKQVGMSAASAALMASIFDVAGVLGSISTGVICDTLFGGRMIGTVLPFVIATAVAFGGWGAVCIAEQVGGKSMRNAHIAAMAIVGFTIAGPDGVLGGAATRNLCDYAGRSSEVALAAAASGIVNGCGSIGAILQGGLTSQLVEAVGWSGLYFTLAGAMVLTALAMLPAVMVEARARPQKK